MSKDLTISPKFEPLWLNKTRYFLVTGGRGSSKSFSIATYLVDLALREPNQVILFTRWTLTSAHISIIPEFIEKIELLGKLNEFSITKTDIECNNGSRIIFRGIHTSSGNQTANLKSIQGVTTWVIDEAEELTDEKTFDKIDDSIRTKTHQNRVIIALNPTTDSHWIYKRFVEKGKSDITTYIHTTYLDNVAHLSQSFIDKANRVKAINPELYEHRYLGKWLDKADGVVFNNWEVGEFDTSLQFIFGQDYGFSNDPTTLIKIAVDKKNSIIYLDECYYKQALSTDQIYELNDYYAGRNIIVGDSSEPRLIDELIRKGNNLKSAVKGQGSVSAGLLAMQGYKIVITKDSHNLGKELRNYIWLDSGTKLVIDDYNHGIDAARYAFQYLTQNTEFKTVPRQQNRGLIAV
jgi:phage terminase large subunit